MVAVLTVAIMPPPASDISQPLQYSHVCIEERLTHLLGLQGLKVHLKAPILCVLFGLVIAIAPPMLVLLVCARLMGCAIRVVGHWLGERQPGLRARRSLSPRRFMSRRKRQFRGIKHAEHASGMGAEMGGREGRGCLTALAGIVVGVDETVESWARRHDARLAAIAVVGQDGFEDVSDRVHGGEKRGKLSPQLRCAKPERPRVLN